MMPAVTASHNAAGWCRIFISGTLHLAFRTGDYLAGVQSWSNSHTRSPAMYAIEITPKKGEAILAEYDDEQLWHDVLAAVSATFGDARQDTGGAK